MTFAHVWNVEAPTDDYDKDVLRMLPIRVVAASLDIFFDANGKALCPFHDDTRPSLDSWAADDSTERVTCSPCGFTEDVLGLIRRVQRCTFREALEYADRIRQEMPPDYVPIKPAPRRPFSEVEVNAARLHAHNVPGLISVLSGFVVPGDEELARSWDAYLRDVWGWGVSLAGTVYMPHWNEAGVMVGAKIRRGSKTSVPGSDFSNLYGSWRPRRHSRVLLTEGESDTAYAAALGLDIDVYGLPSGCGSAIREQWLTFHAPITYGAVYLAFDADDAGRAETAKWLAHLPYATVINLPDSTDLRTSGVDLAVLLR
jgi:hypothetical protein